MYSEKVMDDFSNPRNAGTIENPDGVGEVGNPVYCWNLGVDALLKAIRDYEEKRLGRPRADIEDVNEEKEGGPFTCENCGKENPIDAAFCISCGRRLRN
jgi:hypothetical protein